MIQLASAGVAAAAADSDDSIDGKVRVGRSVGRPLLSVLGLCV